MALKQNSDDTGTLRRAIGPFRDAIEAISSPLPSGLESMLRMERMIEALDVSLPMVGFGPFDGLKSGADIDGGKTITPVKVPAMAPCPDSSGPSRIREHNANDRDGCRPLADCLAKVGMLADEILRSSATGSKVDVNARAVDTVSGAGGFDGRPDMNFQQSKGDIFSKKTGSVTEVVFNDAMPAGSLDKDVVTSLVNDVLVEQARRHGVDLS
ncbi:MAG: hypothetical protein GY737_11305 [Desulfobacteraceae bacterium]|nr:hypothetical protein [Desulfobacteraceae bacterium]